MRRVLISVAGVALVAAMLWPAIAPGELDSLPFSNYSMFAHPRSTSARFDIAVLVDRDGTEHRLGPQEIGGTDQPVQAVETVMQAIREGSTPALCAEIAGGLDVDGTVEIISVRYETIDWFRGDRMPLDREVHAACPVEGSP